VPTAGAVQDSVRAATRSAATIAPPNAHITPAG